MEVSQIPDIGVEFELYSAIDGYKVLYNNAGDFANLESPSCFVLHFNVILSVDVFRACDTTTLHLQCERKYLLQNHWKGTSTVLIYGCLRNKSENLTAVINFAKLGNLLGVKSNCETVGLITLPYLINLHGNAAFGWENYQDQHYRIQWKRISEQERLLDILSTNAFLILGFRDVFPSSGDTGLVLYTTATDDRKMHSFVTFAMNDDVRRSIESFFRSTPLSMQSFHFEMARPCNRATFSVSKDIDREFDPMKTAFGQVHEGITDRLKTVFGHSIVWKGGASRENLRRKLRARRSSEVQVEKIGGEVKRVKRDQDWRIEIKKRFAAANKSSSYLEVLMSLHTGKVGGGVEKGVVEDTIQIGVIDDTFGGGGDYGNRGCILNEDGGLPMFGDDELTEWLKALDPSIPQCSSMMKPVTKDFSLNIDPSQWECVNSNDDFTLSIEQQQSIVGSVMMMRECLLDSEEKQVCGNRHLLYGGSNTTEYSTLKSQNLDVFVEYLKDRFHGRQVDREMNGYDYRQLCYTLIHRKGCFTYEEIDFLWDKLPNWASEEIKAGKQWDEFKEYRRSLQKWYEKFVGERRDVANARLLD